MEVTIQPLDTIGLLVGNMGKLLKGLTTEQFDILRKVKNDVFIFSLYIFLIHPVRGKTPFALYPFQKSVLWKFLTQRFTIVLKFRQAGLTELIAMYSLWLAMYHPNKNIVIISIKERVAKKVLRKIKYMYKNLPEFLQVPVINGRTGEYGTSFEMEFANGSLITSVPTTEEAGRSEGVSLLVIDEAAIIRWASSIWASAFPTLSTGGGAIVNSTPYGIGNWYHKMYVDALSGGNAFFPIRLKWQMHPERDDQWYKEMREALGPRRTAQEIDGDFLTSGYSVFDLGDIRALDYNLVDQVPIRVEYDGCLVILKDAEPRERYYIGADISTGKARDYSTFSIMTRDGEEVGYFKGKIPVSVMADLMMKEGENYNLAMLAPESNDIGLAVTTKIQDADYPNLYYTNRILKEKGENKPKVERLPGWYTTKATRPIIIDQLVEDIREENIEIQDKFFVQEAYTFIYDERNRPVAMGKNNAKSGDDEADDTGYSDDAILAKAITNHVRKTALYDTVIAPV